MKQYISQEFTTNNLVFGILCFGLLFGIFLNNLLPTDFADEFTAAMLAVVCGWYIYKNPKCFFRPVIFFISAFFLFYTAYSFFVHSNTPQAIFYDVIISLKPFIGFFGVFLLAPVLSGLQRKIIRYSCLILAVICAVIAFYSIDSYDIMQKFAGWQSQFYLIVVVLALLYLFCSDFSRTSFLFFFLILAIGLFSGRSKMYVFFVLALSLYFAGFHRNKLKINLKTVLIALAIIAVSLVIAYPKIHFYFLEKNLIYSFQNVRSVLYAESFNLAQTYFPFGTGFASFGSHASVKFASRIYLENSQLFEVLRIDIVKSGYATDAFFACLLGQFGIVGVLAFLVFFAWIFKISLNAFSPKKQYFTLLIILFFLSESFSNSTFTQSFGFMIMMILGYALSEEKNSLRN